MKKIVSSPISLIVGIAVFAFGAIHFAKLAIIPRLPGNKAA